MRAAAVLALAAALADAAAAAPWWPSVPGATFTYEDRTVELTGTPTAFSRLVTRADGVFVEDYAVTKDGDVITGGWQDAGGDRYERWDPPLLWLDLPLAVGATWSTTSNLAHPEHPGEHVVTGRVVRADTVAAPAGTFPVLVVAWEFVPVHATHPPWTVTRRLHAQLGPVTGLVSWTGVVPARSVRWGGLKARYAGADPAR